jgi:hypothetical protein
MAFRTGTQVRPELGRADVSGFARAGMITGQALANLGQDIGEGIEKYQKNKQVTASSLAQLEALVAARPDAYAALNEAGGDISKSISRIAGGDYKQKDLLSTLGAMNTYIASQAQEQQSRLREAQIAQLGRGPTQAEIDKAAADLAKTKAQTAKTEAEIAAMGKPKSLTAAERMRLIETKVGDVTFGQYLQELKKTKAIKGGELHQRGLFNFDEDQIAAFDDVLINYPEFKASGSPRLITLPDGTQVEVTPQ